MGAGPEKYRRGPRRLNRLAASATILCLAVAVAPARGQTEIGAGGGVSIAGPQDVTIKPYDSSGRRITTIQRPGTSVSRGAFWEIEATRWSREHPSIGFSGRLEDWANTVVVPVWPSLRSKTVREERTAAVVELAARRAIRFLSGLEVRGDIGAGALASRLSGVRPQYGAVLTMSAGSVFWLSRTNCGIALDARYLLARDFNAVIADDAGSQNLEFSGTKAPVLAARPILGPHQDGRYLAITLGIRWKI